MFNGVTVVPAVHIGHGQTVVEEPKIKESAFQHLRYVSIEINVGDVVSRFGVSPCCWNGGAILCLKEPDKGNLTG
jgi:hypothetical protein|tara:strand:+ start:153 stop:377 length:225 start_codon:yes stop_codon:yes gene_type:complete